jgi:hypothetical protein
MKKETPDLIPAPWYEKPTVKDLIFELQKLPQDDIIAVSIDRGYTTIDDPERTGHTKNTPDDFTTVTIKISAKKKE